MDDMPTPEIEAGRLRGPNLDGGANHLPPLGNFSTWAGKLEIVHIEDEKQLRDRVPIARLPRWDGFKTVSAKRRVTMALPIPPSIRVPVECKNERAHRVTHTLPSNWSCFWG